MQKEIIEEIKSYKKAIELEPEEASNYYLLAQEYDRAKEYPKAIETCQKAIEYEIKDIESWNTFEFGYCMKDKYFLSGYYNFLASMYEKIENYSQAIEYYNKAIELEPDDAYNYYFLAYVYEAIDEPIKAIELFEKFIEIEPDYINDYYFIAKAYVDREAYPKAIKYYKMVIEEEDELSVSDLEKLYKEEFPHYIKTDKETFLADKHEEVLGNLLLNSKKG